jgi:homoserine kinase
MRRVRVSLPAAITNIGPAIGSLGLAVSLRAELTFTARNDSQATLLIDGTPTDPFSHSTVLAMIHLFQHVERAVMGFQVDIRSAIPTESGLGTEDIFTLAGILGAANLLGITLHREDALRLAGEQIGRADAITAAMFGGLTAASLHDTEPLYQTLAPANMDVVVVVPDIKSQGKRAGRIFPKNVPYKDAVFNLSRLPLLIHAFQQEDFSRLAFLMEDRIQSPALQKVLPQLEAVTNAAHRAGAVAVTVTGEGPAIVAFAPSHHQPIADTICAVFAAEEIPTQSWVLPVDRQGLVISMTQS